MSRLKAPRDKKSLSSATEFLGSSSRARNVHSEGMYWTKGKTASEEELERTVEVLISCMAGPGTNVHLEFEFGLSLRFGARADYLVHLASLCHNRYPSHRWDPSWELSVKRILHGSAH